MDDGTETTPHTVAEIGWEVLEHMQGLRPQEEEPCKHLESPQV